jgi:hypothetical protein
MDTSFICDLTSPGSKAVSVNVQFSVGQKSVCEKKNAFFEEISQILLPFKLRKFQNLKSASSKVLLF